MKNLTFGEAVENLKKGYCVQRAGWNGKGMFIYLNKGSKDFSDGDESPRNPVEGIRGDLFANGDKGTSTRLPNLNMRAATGSTVTGWLASQTDILAEDWTVCGPVPGSSEAPQPA